MNLQNYVQWVVAVNNGVIKLAKEVHAADNNKTFCERSLDSNFYIIATYPEKVLEVTCPKCKKMLN
jgi:hypothetical protein